MKATTIIIGLASVGFILMGLFIMYSKAISKNFSDKDEKSKKFIKQNAIINILVGSFGLIIAIIDYISKNTNMILIIVFICSIFISALIQSTLAKKFRG